LIGGVIIKKENTTGDYPTDFYPSIAGKMIGLDASINSIYNTIVKSDTLDFKQNMTLMSYDIETYTRSNMNPNDKSNYIFAIGCGFFNLTNNIPRRSVCIVSKDFDKLPENVEIEKITLFDKKCYKIIVPHQQTESKDIGEYIITENEKELLKTFINVLKFERPQIITGFNTYGFDDEFVYKRMKLHKLDEEYLQTYSCYDLNVMKEESWFKQFAPKYEEEIPLKIDNNIKRDNKTVKAWSVITTDVYKLILKEDPKRFTQYGRGNLDTMLEVYKIKNPFTGAQLSKTDMKIQEMFRLWDNNEDIYRIALYCRQDAWVTGTLLINRSKLGDLIEMANFSHTLFSDSIYRADGVRVNNSTIAYAYSEKFALKDDPYKNRSKLMKGETEDKLGGKTYDPRNIMGGAVKNLQPGRHGFVVALDLSSAYPSAKEGSSIDSSSRIDEDIIKNPSKYGLKMLWKQEIVDMYGKREIFGIKIK
jgi:DNA polymerase elongation subunit (family B)